MSGSLISRQTPSVLSSLFQNAFLAKNDDARFKFRIFQGPRAKNLLFLVNFEQFISTHVKIVSGRKAYYTGYRRKGHSWTTRQGCIVRTHYRWYVSS